jgi:hypothetical protein
MGLDRPARSRIMEQHMVYVGLDVHEERLPRRASEESCLAWQGLTPRQLRPCGAPRHRRFRSTSGTAGQGLRRPAAS